jgi:hypothetical protein
MIRFYLSATDAPPERHGSRPVDLAQGRKDKTGCRARVTTGSSASFPIHCPLIVDPQLFRRFISTQTCNKTRATGRILQHPWASVHHNAKHTDWGSRLISPRGREVLETMGENYLKHLSSREPTYWPSDRNKLPDLVDFCVTKVIPQDFATVKSRCDLSSDHSPVLVTLRTNAKNREKQPHLSNRHTNWDDFRHLVNEKLTLTVPLQSDENIEAAVKFSTTQCNGYVGTQ